MLLQTTVKPSRASVARALRKLPVVLVALASLVAVSACGGGTDGAGDGGGRAAMAAKKTAVAKNAAVRSGAPGQRAGAAGGNEESRRRSMPAAAVATATARRGDIASFYTATATLQAQKQAQIIARAAGVVSRVEAEEGDEVDEGQELLRIENDEYLYRLREAEANTAKLKARYDRLENMVKQHLVSVEEFETARSELASAQAQEDLARLNLSYTKVTAPFAGVVTERRIDLGQNVNPGDPLYTVADFHPLRAWIHVPAREFRRLSTGQPVTLVLDSNGIRLQGRITLISPVIDAASGTIKVTVEIDDFPPDVRPGDFAQVRVETQRRQGRILVPRAAVISEKGEDVVVLDVDGHAEMRRVETGFSNEDSIEILDGVEEGEQVVVKGQGKLREGQPLIVVEIDGRPVDRGEDASSGRPADGPPAAGGRGRAKGSH